MSQKRENQRLSKKILTEKIEQHARDQGLPFMQAGRIVCSTDKNFDLVVDALGSWYRGRLPSDRTIRRLMNEDYVFLAKKWPKAELHGVPHEDLYYLLLPYLKSEHRKPKQPGRYEALRQKAEQHFARGYSRAEIVKMLGISKATVYRWFPMARATGQTSALGEVNEHG